MAAGRQLDAPEVSALDERDPVMLREPLVQERVIRRDQLEDALLLAQDALDEELRLRDEVFAQPVVEIPEQEHVRLLELEIAQEEPLRREILDERVRARI